MADFDSVQSIRGARLSDLAQHVDDALAISLVDEDKFQVGKLIMASYDFVPYALTGLSAAMQSPANGVRATTRVTIPLNDDKGGTATVEQDVTLFGPGDVLAIDPGQIVRRYPSPGSTNAEETFHAHIEFDRPELPWAFSATTPGNKMLPWLALVVFEHDEIEWEPSHAGLQPIASVSASVLPPLEESWAWAHGQATSGTSSLSARLSTAYAPVNVSRLLAARILTQNTNYIACLVPTTDAGRKAGLGLTGGTLGPAWSPQDGTVRLPVYDRWEFRTAPDGDFARLARRLKGVAAPWEIGRRTMDASRPGAPLADLAPHDVGRRQVIKCALFSPAQQPPEAPSDLAAWSPAHVEALKTALERPAVIEGTAGKDPGVVPDLPIVGPRIYAKAQRGTSTVPSGDWFAALNLAPVHRVVAGLGTRVVVKDQELLMQAAWEQVGEIDKANRELALAEFARHLAGSMHDRMAKIDAGRLLQITRPLASRVRLDGSALSFAGQTVRSATPTSALSGSFRRVSRGTGPLARRLAPTERATLAALVGTEGANRDFTRAYVELDGIGGLSATALKSLDARDVATTLQTTQDNALVAVKNASDVLGRGHTLATSVSTPSAWNAPDTSFRPGPAVAERIVTKIRERVPVDPGRDVVKSRSLGGLAAGLAVSNIVGTTVLHDVALDLETSVMSVVAHSIPSASLPVVVRTAPARDVGALMMRIGASPVNVETRPSDRIGLIAGSGAAAVTHGGLSAAQPVSIPGTELLGSIARPVARPVGVGVTPLSDRERLDAFRTPQGTQLATWIERAEKVTVLDLRAQIKALIDAPGALSLAATPAREVLTVRRNDVLGRLDPDRTVIDMMRARLRTGKFKFDAFEGSLIRPIMAAPRFDRPMYQALDSYDREWLVPGLGTFRESELVTLLSTNDEFTEAFLVGLSDEMGRELLWRSYPTDARGTYFHRFWDPGKDELLQPIHRFGKTKLGSHVSMGPSGQSGRAVVVIRGELVRRYPDLTVMALHEQGPRDADDLPVLPEAPTGLPDAAKSLFHAMLEPDIMLAGLDITVRRLREEGGWWIVLSEHPQATRFRREPGDLVGHEVRFSTAAAASSGAVVARERLEHPTRIAFEARDFLPSLPSDF